MLIDLQKQQHVGLTNYCVVAFFTWTCSQIYHHSFFLFSSFHSCVHHSGQYISTGAVIQGSTRLESCLELGTDTALDYGFRQQGRADRDGTV
jgi:hypothetical protein